MQTRNNCDMSASCTEPFPDRSCFRHLAVEYYKILYVVRLHSDTALHEQQPTILRDQQSCCSLVEARDSITLQIIELGRSQVALVRPISNVPTVGVRIPSGPTNSALQYNNINCNYYKQLYINAITTCYL